MALLPLSQSKTLFCLCFEFVYQDWINSRNWRPTLSKVPKRRKRSKLELVVLLGMFHSISSLFSQQLFSFTRRISDLIAMYTELGEWSLNREKESLELLYEAVEDAKELVSSCSQHYCIIGSLKANELKEEFSQWGESVAQALIEFAGGEEFGDVELEMEFQMEINALTEHMSGAKFVDKEMTTQCVFAQSLLDSLESLSQSPGHSTLSKLVDEVIDDSSFDSAVSIYLLLSIIC